MEINNDYPVKMATLNLPYTHIWDMLSCMYYICRTISQPILDITSKTFLICVFCFFAYQFITNIFDLGND